MLLSHCKAPKSQVFAIGDSAHSLILSALDLCPHIISSFSNYCCNSFRAWFRHISPIPSDSASYTCLRCSLASLIFFLTNPKTSRFHVAKISLHISIFVITHPSKSFATTVPSQASYITPLHLGVFIYAVAAGWALREVIVQLEHD